MFADMPYTELDRLVRGELAAGRTVAAVFDDLNPHVNAVLGLAELPPDGEDAFLGTLDALTGNCRSEYCYTAPVTRAARQIRPVA
ncbi:MAG: hypothetical protein ACRC7O_17700 [Fimbriiglobus sp.]